MAIELTTENYGEVAASKLPCFDRFRCRMVRSLPHGGADCRRVGRRVRRPRVDLHARCGEESDDIVATYKVRNIPTLVFLEGWTGVARIVGATTKAEIVDKLSKLL